MTALLTERFPVDRTNAERQRRYIAKLKAAAAQPQPVTNGKLDEELAQAKQEISALKAELADTVGARFAPKQRAAKPKAEKPPLPPDEARDKKIKALTTENKNLKQHILYLLEHSRDGSGSMNFATQSAIAKCLHPDRAPSETDRATACRLFTSWKADNAKAQRKGR